jgi:hypothetical protein
MSHYTTYGKRAIDLSHVQVEDIDIEDIAHHLSCINRFNGALKIPVSVAQHSVFVSLLCDGTGHELHGLLHDGGEAYVGDMTKWLKESDGMERFRDYEDRAQESVYTRFGLTPKMPDCVKDADRLMVRFEADQSGITINHPMYGPVTIDELTSSQRRVLSDWYAWPWTVAKFEFLRRFHALHSGV